MVLHRQKMSMYCYVKHCLHTKLVRKCVMILDLGDEAYPGYRWLLYHIYTDAEQACLTVTKLPWIVKSMKLQRLAAQFLQVHSLSTLLLCVLFSSLHRHVMEWFVQMCLHPRPTQTDSRVIVAAAHFSFPRFLCCFQQGFASLKVSMLYKPTMSSHQYILDYFAHFTSRSVDFFHQPNIPCKGKSQSFAPSEFTTT